MAWGAEQRQLTGIFVVNGLVLAAVGVAACGLATSAALTRLLGSSLFGVSPIEGTTFGVT